jgi:putative oxidoreductase
MTSFGSEKIRDAVLLVARILLVALYLIFGWSKLTDYSGTVAFMVQSGAPIPPLAAAVAIIVEVFTRPLAVLLALYTIAAALIGHPYWTMTGADHYENMINFYKNVSIMSGFILLYVTGAGKYSIDAKLGLR